jgi:hypothetical protein
MLAIHLLTIYADMVTSLKVCYLLLDIICVSLHHAYPLNVCLQ